MIDTKNPKIYLTVIIGGINYAIPALDVFLIDDKSESVWIPVFGSSNRSGVLVGDTVMPHVDIYDLFGIEIKNPKKTLQIKTEADEFAISVDAVGEIINVEDSSIKRIPSVFESMELSQIINKAILREGQIVPIISVANLVSSL